MRQATISYGLLSFVRAVPMVCNSVPVCGASARLVILSDLCDSALASHFHLPGVIE